jgi:hypothetical protein
MIEDIVSPAKALLALLQMSLLKGLRFWSLEEGA